MATTTERGYGYDHQKTRAQLAPFVATGTVECAERICLEATDGRGRRIRPGQPWDLAHDRRTGDYLGPAHQRCNRAEGRRYQNWVRATRGQRRTPRRRWTL